MSLPKMRIIRDYKNCPEAARGGTIALGNFDGVHKGHVAVINKAVEIARRNGSTSAVLTFEPHPLTVLRPGIKPFRLTTKKQKIEIFESLGVDNLFVIDFSEEFSKMKAEEFIDEVLIESLGADHIITGKDFIFGNNREGNAQVLAKAAVNQGISYTCIAPVGGEEVFSSSNIRKSLEEGDLSKAKEMLERNFIIDGVVIEGNKQGRILGFPTINIELSDYIRPVFGVYSAQIYVEGIDKILYGAVNIGKRPTIDGQIELLEAHIFDFSENIYGKTVRIELIEYIREEKKFSNLVALTKQIDKDCEKIKSLFRLR